MTLAALTLSFRFGKFEFQCKCAPSETREKHFRFTAIRTFLSLSVVSLVHLTPANLKLPRMAICKVEILVRLDDSNGVDTLKTPRI